MPHKGVPGASAVKNLSATQEPQEYEDSISGSRRSPGGGHGNSLLYACLENPWTEEPGGLQSMGSQRVRHDWSSWARTHKRMPGQCVCTCRMCRKRREGGYKDTNVLNLATFVVGIIGGFYFLLKALFIFEYTRIFSQITCANLTLIKWCVNLMNTNREINIFKGFHCKTHSKAYTAGELEAVNEWVKGRGWLLNKKSVQQWNVLA